ncbi:hypothetical protein D3C80_1759760 [compost metagenome]
MTLAVLPFEEEDFLPDALPPLTFSFCPTSMVYGGDMPFILARSRTLVPVIREILESVSPRWTV